VVKSLNLLMLASVNETCAVNHYMQVICYVNNASLCIFISILTTGSNIWIISPVNEAFATIVWLYTRIQIINIFTELNIFELVYLKHLNF